MERQSLEDEQIAIAASFDELAKEKETHANRVSEIDTELVRLQGEYRAIGKLIDNYKEKDVPHDAKRR